jgi:hypothetical protein
MASDPLSLAVSYIQQNNSLQLESLLQSVFSPNSIVPQFVYRRLTRFKVPLLCVAVAYDSYDCLILLAKHGASLDLKDGVSLVFPTFLFHFRRTSNSLGVPFGPSSMFNTSS